ncbi:hypothetical protein HHL11_21350 [Ramlibacter sp. G-1-2-2]|uniref:Uncharacterized protein n=1 Tax=Ramlibacter agri TaxID=2728837 RepID=A0A848HA35_9BURK|nr:hypothetical protein [Ramlibacter agri]NML46310.1 hypothetical protein [Ramlibacter agri]
MFSAADARMLKRDALACWKLGPLARPVQVVARGAPLQFWCRGPFTQHKFLAGRSLPEVECILGLEAGALAGGADVYDMTRMPQANEFEVDEAATEVPRWRPAGCSFVTVRKLASIGPGGCL